METPRRDCFPFVYTVDDVTYIDFHVEFRMKADEWDDFVDRVNEALLAKKDERRRARRFMGWCRALGFGGSGA